MMVELDRTLSSDVVAEGSVVTGKVTRNTGTNGSVAGPRCRIARSEVQLPPAGHDPAGQNFASFTSPNAGTELRMGIQNRRSTIYSLAFGFQQCAANLNVSDIGHAGLAASPASLFRPTA